MENLIRARTKTRKGFQDEDWPHQFLEKISCPLCGSKNFTKLYPKFYRRLVVCKNCDLIYTNPRLRREHLEHLYSEDYFKNTESSHFGYEDYLGDEKKIVKTFSGRVKEIEKLAPKGKILDVGCATGFFLKAASDRDWKVGGVEISEFASKYAREHFKFNVHQGDFLSLNLPKNSYDVITLWDVIEHFYDPKYTLHKVNRMLKGGGLLVISTPDVDSLPAKLTRDKWVGYKLSDEHLTYFSSKTIKRILEDTGFKVVKKNHVGKHVSIQMLSDRVSIYSPMIGKTIKLLGSFLPDNYFLYVNPFDIMCIYAKKITP
jgi:2-polyprenyl-3-methyl-5-hydroxy-6-metoxy-1,4-benzoquinol methylase